jgi:hypothetical protein
MPVRREERYSGPKTWRWIARSGDGCIVHRGYDEVFVPFGPYQESRRTLHTHLGYGQRTLALLI